MQESAKNIHVCAAIVPRVTCDLPSQKVPFKAEWNHLSDLTLADPDFGRPGKIDLPLGVDVFCQVVRQGQRSGNPGSPSAFETDFGWVLAGSHICPSSLIIPPLRMILTFCGNSGRLKSHHLSPPCSLQKNTRLCSTSRITMLHTYTCTCNLYVHAYMIS